MDLNPGRRRTVSEKMEAAAATTGNSDTNRRFFERLPQRSVLRVQDVADPSTDQFAVLLDISRSGARLEVAREFKAGALVVLYLPKTQFGAPRMVKGRVMWCAMSTETVGWRQIGCRFSR